MPTALNSGRMSYLPRHVRKGQYPYWLMFCFFCNVILCWCRDDACARGVTARRACQDGSFGDPARTDKADRLPNDRSYPVWTTFLRMRSDSRTKSPRSRAFSSSSERVPSAGSSAQSAVSGRRRCLLRSRCSVPMTNTPIQITERAPKPLRPNELSRAANLSPKIEAHGASQ
jgi:hypothetical protein